MSQTLASGLLKIEADAFQKRLPSEQSTGGMDISYLANPHGRRRWRKTRRRRGESRGGTVLSEMLLRKRKSDASVIRCGGLSAVLCCCHTLQCG